MPQGYALSLFAQQTFYDVIDAGGSVTSSIVVPRSLPFATYFIASVGRCQATRMSSACQALANLCALTLYNKDHPACTAFQVDVLSPFPFNSHASREELGAMLRRLLGAACGRRQQGSLGDTAGATPSWPMKAVEKGFTSRSVIARLLVAYRGHDMFTSRFGIVIAVWWYGACATRRPGGGRR